MDTKESLKEQHGAPKPSEYDTPEAYREVKRLWKESNEEIYEQILAAPYASELEVTDNE